MNRFFLNEGGTPFYNHKSDFDKIYEYEENLYNDPFGEEEIVQKLKNTDFKNNKTFLKKFENERYFENN